MKKSKGVQLVDKSYSRRSHYGKELDQWSLGAAIKSVKALSKLGTTGGGSKGQTKAHRTVHKAPKPTLSPNAEGITPLLPIFDGKKSFVCWLSQVENYFRGKYFSDLKKYELVVSCLKGFALLWFTSLKTSRTMKGKSLIRSWSKLEHHMKREYLPSYDLFELSDGLRKEKQKLLDLVGNVKPHTTPSPNLESKLENVEVYLEPEPEIVKQIDLSSTCSFGDVGCDTSTCIVVPLGTLECESLNFSYPNTKNEGTSLSSEPLKPPRTNPTLTHCDTHTHTPLPTETTCQETCLFFPNKDEKDHLKVERNMGLNVKILNQPCFKYPHSETGLKRRNMSFRNSLQDLGLPTKFMSPMSIKTEFIIQREDMGGFDKGKSKFLILVFDPGEKRKCNW